MMKKMATGRLFGIIFLLTLLLTSLHMHQVRAGEREEIARKLIKLFLATAILSPPGVGTRSNIIIGTLEK